MRFTTATWSGPEQANGDWLYVEVRGEAIPFVPASWSSPAEGGDLEDVEVREDDGQRPVAPWRDLEDWAALRGLSRGDVEALLERVASALEEDCRHVA